MLHNPGNRINAVNIRAVKKVEMHENALKQTQRTQVTQCEIKS